MLECATLHMLLFAVGRLHGGVSFCLLDYFTFALLSFKWYINFLVVAGWLMAETLRV